MRRILFVIVLLACVFAATASATGDNGDYKGNPIVKVIVDQMEVHSEVPAIKLDGTTLIPLRAVAENLGAKVAWNEETQTALVTKEKKSKDQSEDQVDKENKDKQYIEILTKLKKHVQDTKVIHERMQMLYELYQAETTYKRTNDNWDIIIDKEIPQMESRIITLLESLEQLNSHDKVLTPDQYSDLNKKILFFRDVINKYELAVESFDKYRNKKETDDRRNMLLFMYDAYNMITELETQIDEIKGE